MTATSKKALFGKHVTAKARRDRIYAVWNLSEKIRGDAMLTADACNCKKRIRKAMAKLLRIDPTTWAIMGAF